MGSNAPLEINPSLPADQPGLDADQHHALLVQSGFAKDAASDNSRPNPSAFKSGEKVSSEFPSEYAVAKAFQAGNLLNKDWMASNSEQRYLVDYLGNAASQLGSIPSGVTMVRQR